MVPRDRELNLVSCSVGVKVKCLRNVPYPKEHCALQGATLLHTGALAIAHLAGALSGN